MASPQVVRAQKLLNEYMARGGRRRTRQRDAIVEVFLAWDGHATLQDLLTEVLKTEPGIGFATVYRTMKMLVEAGVAEEHRFAEGQTCFELLGADHHDHLICTGCGHIEEFEDPAIEARQQAVALALKWTVSDHVHEIYGLCPDCQAKASSVSPG